MHISEVMVDSPIELINITPVNPLISKCQIKVCYVSEEPNRNRSVITKETARQMANSLPGSPIVGYYNEATKDFEEHNRIIDISGGVIKLKDTTRPYGFVDLGAKVWFQKFLDDGINEREYLMTEGYLWTGQYPECQRVIDQGNNQSMELDEETLNATWAKDNNKNSKFFIINEAIVSKLCILGEEYEPCFEGSHISTPTIQFSFEDSFKEQLFSMMKELKDLLSKGETEQVFTRSNVEIGDALWTALYSFIENNYSDENGLMYSIQSICENEEQKFVVLNSEEKSYKLAFSCSEDETLSFEELQEMEEFDTSEPQFSKEAVEEYSKNKKEQDKKEKENSENSDDNTEDKKCPKCGKPEEECTCGKNKYVLEEIPEYVELQATYAALKTQYNELKAVKERIESEMTSLIEFRNKVEKEKKEEMIKSFYMLSDDDKADVIKNIDTYSLDDIEAKLSIICVRNKVSFALDDETNKESNITTYNLGDSGDDDLATPAWVKAALAVAARNR